MSQIYVPSSGGGGGGSISFVTNSGTATPAANIINILGSGNLTTTGSGNTITISDSSEFIGTGTTVNAQRIILLSVPIPTLKGFIAISDVVGYDSVNDAVVGAQLVTIGKNDGSVVITTTQSTFFNSDVPITTAQITVVSNATNYAVQVTGVLGFVINWKTISKLTISP